MMARPRTLNRIAIIEAYAAGVKTEAIASAHDTSRAHVCRISNSAGFRRGAASKAPVATCLAMWEAGFLQKQIAFVVGLSPSQISRVAKQNSFPRRQRRNSSAPITVGAVPAAPEIKTRKK